MSPTFGGANPDRPRRTIIGRVYEKFKPIYEWRREDDHDSLLIYLPGFRKEFIKVTTENPNILRVRGERFVPGNKWNWFHEDFKVSETCKMSIIRAKFDGGILTITMPHKFVNPPIIQEPTKNEKQHVNSTKSGSSTLAANIPSQPPLTNPMKPKNVRENGHKSLDETNERMKVKREMVMKMAVMVLIGVFGIYVSYIIGNLSKKVMAL